MQILKIISFTFGLCCLILLTGTAGAISYEDMDTSINPGDDLFSYANGNWIERNPVPADLISYSSVSEVMLSVNERVREMIEDAAANPQEDGYEHALIGTFYNTALDSQLADRVGIEPLRSELMMIDAVQTRQDLQNATITLMGLGISPFFSFYADEDPGNSSMLIATTAQSGMSLPDREYYFRDDTESQRVRDEFKGHVARMFMLMNVSPEQADINAARVLQIETRLAQDSAPSHGYGKPDRRYFPCPVSRLNEVTDGIDWDGLLTSVNRTDLEIINMYQPLYIQGVGNTLKEEPIEDLKVFLQFKVLEFAAPYASSAFEEEFFNFYYRVLSGQKEMEPRWKRVMATMDSVMGGAVGKLYIARYFTEEEKEDVTVIVENLKDAFRSRLVNLTWMEESTKNNATAMLDEMVIQIGYPERWGDYSSLDITDQSYLDNILNITSYYYYAGLQIAGTPSDPDVWYLSPHSVNAYYDTTRNKIVLPAGVLQPPFYDPDVDSAEHYGAIGSIIGHEIVHGFDTPLRKFTFNGTEVSLWSEQDTRRFEEATGPLVRQFDEMEGMSGLYLNGSRMLSENAADLGGITIAYDAWNETRNIYPDVDSGSSLSSSFTDEQRFFLAYAQAWRGTIRDEELRNMILIEQHPWNRFRVNTVPFNLDEFYEAFSDVKPGTLLYRSEDARARIW